MTMPLKQVLQQKQSLHIHMTPQLRHAIKLLELAHMDLTAYLQDICLDNPLLQVEDPPHISLESPEREENPYDYYWEVNGVPDNDKPLKSPEKTLYEHVYHQINLTFSKGRLKTIALFMLDHLDTNGYLTVDLTYVAQQVQSSFEMCQTVLKNLQTLEPTGIFAQNLQECLKLQALEKGFKEEDMDLFFAHIDYFLKGDFHKLTKIFNTPEAYLKSFLHQLRQLNPKPGQLFHAPDVSLPSPDLLIFVTPSHHIRVQLNERRYPQLHCHPISYTGTDVQTISYLKSKHYEAQWLMKALQQRKENLLKVGVSLTDYQKEFFLKGPQALKPMTLKTIADLTGLHESTVSRLTSGKYVHTPYGIRELKSFFSGALQAIHHQDEAVSVQRVKKDLANLIKEESLKAPYSDDQLVFQLAQQGINISRRTVTKYREQLKIPSSYERKRLAQRQAFQR